MPPTTMKSSDNPGITAAFKEHLHIVPKLDKTQYITAYLKQQSSFIKAYALQGRALSTIEGRQDNNANITTTPTRQEVTGDVDFGFTTPVLKPRKPVTVRTIRNINNSPPFSRGIQVISHDVSSGIVQKAGEENVQPLGKPTNKSSIATEATDRKARLEERRRRRRDKQEVANPEAENQGLVKSKQRHPKKKGKTDIANGGFALMHGFSATNVGQGRLTIKASLQNAGVFGKGKASTATKTTVGVKRPAAKDFRMPEFLESEFLNKSKWSTRKRQLSNSEASSMVSVNHDEPTKQANKKTKILSMISTKKAYKAAGSGNKPPKSVYQPTTEKSDSHSIVDEGYIYCGKFTKSIIWDIEKDDVHELPSSPGNPSEERVFSGTRGLQSWYLSDGKSETQGIGEDDHNLPLCDKDVISLCPSESASQHGCHDKILNIERTLKKSKYFTRSMTPDHELEASVAIQSVPEPKEGLNPSCVPVPELLSKEGTCLSRITSRGDLERHGPDFAPGFGQGLREPCCDIGSMSVDCEVQSRGQVYGVYAEPNMLGYQQMIDTNFPRYGRTLNDELSYISFYESQEAIADLSRYFDDDDFQEQTEYIMPDDCDGQHRVLKGHVELGSLIDDECDQEAILEKYGREIQSAVSSNICEVPADISECVFPYDTPGYISGSSLDGFGGGNLLLGPIPLMEVPHVLPHRRGYQGPLAITTAEANVARSLKHHWLPQKL